MHIVHVAAEFAPVIKAGGLGDVLLGLSRELQRQKHQVDVLLPRYDCIRLQFLEGFKKTDFTFTTDYKGYTFTNSVWEGYYGGIKLTFIHPEAPLNFFDRGEIYGQVDDIDRFVYFSKACADYLAAKKIRPDIVQTHDWHTSLMPLLLKERVPVVQTIHNLHYQGRCDAYHLDSVGIPSSQYLQPTVDPKDGRLTNLLKAGIVYSQAIITVSPTYRKEILTKEFGEGLEETLRDNEKKLYGILNGLDFTYWDPGNDRVLPLPYGADRLETRAQIRDILKKNIGLSGEEKPLVCSISRLVPQKGLPLIQRALYKTLENGGQFILVGSSPIPEVAEEFLKIKESFKENRNVAMILSFEHELVHWVYGGCDMIVVPSEFEPCGLTQLIALRYGTLPIVRKTGGLADTVVDLSEHPQTGNGFIFEHSDVASFDFTLDRALNLWHNDRDSWKKVVRRAMQEDHSWSNQAGKYVEIYQKLSKKIYEFA